MPQMTPDGRAASVDSGSQPKSQAAQPPTALTRTSPSAPSASPVGSGAVIPTHRRRCPAQLGTPPSLKDARRGEGARAQADAGMALTSAPVRPTCQHKSQAVAEPVRRRSSGKALLGNTGSDDIPPLFGGSTFTSPGMLPSTIGMRRQRGAAARRVASG